MADTTTGMRFVGLAHKIITDIPYVHLCTHEDLALMDDTYKGYVVTQVSIGGNYDGSYFVQELMNISSDINKVIYHCPPLTKEEQRSVILSSDTSAIICKLDVTHNMRLLRQFPAVEKDGRLYLSAGYFPHPNMQCGSSKGQGDLHGLHCTGWPQGLPYLSWFSSWDHHLVEQFFQYELFPIKSHDTNNETTDWRISFFTLENTIIKCMWTREERKAYCLFKCLVKRHVCMPEYITTYMLKNIMFLAHDDLKWTHCDRYEIHLLGVLDKLIHCLIQAFLPLYFVQSVNLLADIPSYILNKAAMKLSTLRQSLDTLPGDLGMYGTSQKNRKMDNKFIDILVQHAMVNIRRDQNDGKFVEIGDLHSNPHTVLFIWESYLYKGLEFLGKGMGGDLDESTVQLAMIHNRSQATFYNIWRGFIQYAELKGRLLGYAKNQKLYQPPRLERTTVLKCIYYMIYNGTFFDICGRPMQSVDYSKSTVKYLSSMDHGDVFYDSEVEITANNEEKHFATASVNTVWLMNIIRCCCCYNQIKLDNAPFKTKVSWAANWIMLHVNEDVEKSSFVELGHLYNDPDTLLYMTQSCLELAGQIIDPDSAMFALKAMLTIRGRSVVADLWRWFRELNLFNPEIFGNEPISDVRTCDITMERAYQIGFDGEMFTIFYTALNRNAQISGELEQISDDIYFNTKVKRVDVETSSESEAILHKVQHNMKPSDLDNAIKDLISDQRNNPLQIAKGICDTTTGINSEDLRRKVLAELPFLPLCAHEDLALSDDTYQDIGVTELLCGGDYDGTGFIQKLMNISSDTDTMIYRTCPLTKDEQIQIIRYNCGSSIYCTLDVTDHLRLQVEFPTIKKDGRLFLSAKYFRQSRREHLREEQRDVLGDPILKTDDTAGRASSVEYFHGGQQRDCVHCIPCVGWPIGVPYIKSSSQDKDITNWLQYHLIPKCSPGGDINTEWRISFSVIEQALIKTTWDRQERLTYGVLKCLIKRHLCFPEYITTYHLKTIMFLAHDNSKCNSCSRFEIHLLRVIDSLLHCLIDGHLPMYFVKEINLFEDTPIDILQKAAEKISLLRQSLIKLPGHLGILSKSMSKAEVEISYFKIMIEHASTNIRKDLNDGKFVELGDLHANPQTMLYIWESYLYKALKFTGETNERKSHPPVMCNSSQSMFAKVWHGFIDYVLCKGQLLGYKKSRGLDPVQYKKPGLLLTTGPKHVYYLTYNGAYFDIEERKMTRKDHTNRQCYCILPYTDTYYCYTPEIITPEKHDMETVDNVCMVINNMPCMCYTYFSMKNASLKCKVVWAVKWVIHQFNKDILEGKYIEMVHLPYIHKDPECIMFIIESYLRLAADIVDHDEDLFVVSVLQTEDGQFLMSEIQSIFSKIWLEILTMFEAQMLCGTDKD